MQSLNLFLSFIHGAKPSTLVVTRSRTTVECGRRLLDTRHHRRFPTGLTDYTLYFINRRLFCSRFTPRIRMAAQSQILWAIAARLGTTPQHSAQSENHRVDDDGVFGFNVIVVFQRQAVATACYFFGRSDGCVCDYADSHAELIR